MMTILSSIFVKLGNQGKSGMVVHFGKRTFGCQCGGSILCCDVDSLF